MATFFISDLHLQASKKEITHRLFRFLTDYATKADALYILGDLFEVWIGDDDHNDFSHAIIAMLHSMKNYGVPVYLMHGNRDFLLGEKFAQSSHCQLLPDPFVIDLYGQKTLLTHGDLMCCSDQTYQAARRRMRNINVQAKMLSKPLWMRKMLAKYYRWRSAQHQKDLKSEIADIDSSAALALFQSYQVDTMIHGHTHRPGIHYMQANDDWKQRIVLSDWEEKGHMLVYYPDGNRELRFFDDDI